MQDYAELTTGIHPYFTLEVARLNPHKYSR
jgi:hypothetical protein